MDGANHEVLVCYPAEEATFPNRVLVYSWLDNVWSFESVEDGIRCIDEASIPTTPAHLGRSVRLVGAMSGTGRTSGRITRKRALFQLGTAWSQRSGDVHPSGVSYRVTTYTPQDASRRRLTTGTVTVICALSTRPMTRITTHGLSGHI